MDWNLLMIFLFIIVMVAILGGIVNDIANRIIAYKQSRSEGSSDNSPAEVAMLTEKTSALEDRVRVLERIATDREGGTDDLARQIEQLRDPQQLDNGLQTRETAQ